MSAALPTISVCMATYNGAEFVAEQLESILNQLNDCDELVIVDDGSTDNTLRELRRIAAEAHCRVLVERSDHNSGHVHTFERALHAARNDLVVLADQDDVWLPGYVDRIRTVFNEDVETGLIVSRPVFCDENLVPIAAKNERYRHPKFNGPIGVAAFLLNRSMPIGCTMSIRRADLGYVLPFPAGLLAHDHWLFAMATLRGRMRPLDEPALLYRRHPRAVTHKRNLSKAFASRAALIGQVVQRLAHSAVSARRRRR